MPARPAPNRIARVAIVGLIALAAQLIHMLISNSANPGAYHGYRHDPSGFVYPTYDVAQWSIAIAVETLGASGLLLWRNRSPISRCAAVAAIFATIFVFCIPGLMHAPPYYSLHAGFLVLAAMWLGFVALVAGVARWLGFGANRDRDPAELPAATVKRDSRTADRD